MAIKAADNFGTVHCPKKDRGSSSGELTQIQLSVQAASRNKNPGDFGNLVDCKQCIHGMRTL